MPSGAIEESLAVLESIHVPGDPVIQLENGSVLVPGLNTSLSANVTRLLPSLKESDVRGIVIESSL